MISSLSSVELLCKSFMIRRTSYRTAP